MSPQDRRRRRILIIAEAANPEWVSVPLIGWSLSEALRKVTDAHVVTHVRNREAFLRAGLEEGTDFTAIDTESIDRPLWRLSQVLRMGKGKGWTMVTALKSLSYPFFERKVWKIFGAAIRRGEYDLVHRITPLSPAINSPLAWKVSGAGIPFILGPINGGVPWPAGFNAERRNEREWLSYLRSFFKLSPSRRRMLRATHAIIAGSRRAQKELPDHCQKRTFFIPENAVDPTRFNQTTSNSLQPTLRGCFVGRLVPLKGVDMLLDAAESLLRDGTLALDIVGDGPLHDDLKRRAVHGGYASSVTFHGWLEHRDVQTILSQSNLLTFPSIREFGGGVVLEAMMLGVVPLVIDYGGPGELVDASVGYKVPIGSRAAIVSALRDRLTFIASNRDVLPALSEAAQNRVVQHFTWEAKAKQILEVYDWVLGDRDSVPDLTSWARHRD